MSKQPKWIQRAMNLAIRRIRFEQASLHLDKDRVFDDDTEQIREATRLYVESWIVPLLKKVRDGDYAGADFSCRGENCSDPG